EGSKLGYCEYSAYANASNGIGYCKAKEQFKKGIAGDCDSTCGDCTFKGKPGSNDTTQRPTYYCVNSKANTDGGGCKWVNDNSTVQGGYCVNKGEKTCEDACDRCKVQIDCSNTGRTSIANQSGSCKWQTGTESCVANIGEDVEICWDGTDNTDDGLIDCADPSCYADTFCGFVAGDCFGWTTNSTCIAGGCEWVTDKWGQWCDFKGSQCWKYDGNETACTGRTTIINESLNITAARLNASHNINATFSFALTNNGSGWVSGSISIKNASGYTLGTNYGNFTVDYQRRIINFSNNTYTVSVLTNVTFVDYQYYPATEKQNCQWNNGTGSGWCERDWSRAELCMGYNNTKCMQLNSSIPGYNCNWTIDTWCAGQGNSSSWCQTSGGGWCDHNDFKPKNCWQHTAGSSDCNNQTGCNWRTDAYSQPHCEVNWSGNCWQYTSNATCSAVNTCWWRNDSWGGWCTNLADKCWSANETTCSSQTNNNSISICYWQSSWGGGGSSGSSGWCQPNCYNSSTTSTCTTSPICNWKAESGWCEESEMAACSNMTNNNNETACRGTSGCRWKNPGWCDPKGGGFSAGAGASGGGVGTAMGADCYKYDGNQSLCTNKSIINISCGWMTETNPRCEVNWGVSNCWQYISVDSGCTGTNGCWWKNDTWGG
ncbi:hypothetical protein HZB88_02085, partial [archaeon]|nr:hypothetical protein [archaeon]